MKKLFTAKRLIRFIFAVFIISTVFVIIRIILAPSVVPQGEDGEGVRVKADYILMFLQSLLGIAAMLLPRILKQKAGLVIPTGMILGYAVFLFCAIYLGEVRAFYYRFENWDAILHTFSGAALGALGFSFVSLLNRSEKITFELSPFFVALFAFCFALALGTLWELYEFGMDYLFGTNMQKFALETGELFVGQEALKDTMTDFIVDSLGALGMSIIGYISLRFEKGWTEKLRIKKQ
ncbi:MAG: hypothetical protein FWG70_03275 [Oscillospiraceae bacterium]|nr:hypothetical protein [Oscillospiraceae bacterium]